MKEDIAVFEEWMGHYSRDIERLAFQYGCSPEQAAQLAEETFREIYNDKEKMNEGKLFVYKIALERLGRVEQLMPVLESPMPFEEDAAFHSQIVKLAEQYRMPLVLQKFHAFSVEEIAMVMTIPMEEVETALQVATKSIKEAVGSPSADIVEKRIEFLRKSYERLPSLFNVANVVRQESVPVAKEHKKLGRKGWMTAIILGVLLVGLVGSTYFTGEDWELRSDRKYIEGLEKEFAELFAEKQAILGISDAVFNQITYYRSIQENLKSLIMELKDKNQEGEKIDRQLAEAWLLDLPEVMKLPSELADELFAAPLVLDAERSMMFAEVYLMKVDAVRYSLYELYGNDYDRLREALKTGTLDAKAILAQQDGYSENTIEAIKALASQKIERLLPEESLGHSEFVAQLRAVLHESADSYLTQYEREPFMMNMNEKLLYSLDETTGFIAEMEEMVVMSRNNGWGGHSVEGTMLNLLDAILQGRTIEEFENSDGSISEVHRNAWKRLALLGPDSGVSAIMTKIVEEMEASDWQYSEFHNSLKEYRIYEAYSFASRNELEQFSLQPFEVKVAYNEKIFKLPDNNLDNTVADLYDKFSVAYDRTVLANVHPLFIVGLFYYANDKGDAAMMWHLTDQESRTSSIEEYTGKEIALLEVTDSILFTPSLIMATTGRKTTAPIEFERNGKTYYNVWMTYGEGQVWQIDSIVIEEGSL